MVTGDPGTGGWHTEITFGGATVAAQTGGYGAAGKSTPGLGSGRGTGDGGEGECEGKEWLHFGWLDVLSLNCVEVRL